MSDNGAPTTPAEGASGLRERVIAALKTCYDPEIPVDIYELGLIYDVAVNEANTVEIKMTLTSPHCPVAESLPLEVQQKVVMVEGVNDAKVDITWDPPWTPEMMSEAARLELNL
jgi:FeS assembly SUF system protein